jgi:hypothetical protein
MADLQTLINAVRDYRDNRHEHGSFIMAVLENNLHAAISRADGTSWDVIRELMQFVYFDLPADCWGSREAVSAWLHPPVTIMGETPV